MANPPRRSLVHHRPSEAAITKTQAALAAAAIAWVALELTLAVLWWRTRKAADKERRRHQ